MGAEPNNKLKYTILLVEDDQVLKNMYKTRLTSEGYNILSANDGQEAEEVFKREKVDLIITDIMLPRVTGVEFLQKVRETKKGKSVPAIVWTNLTFEEEKNTALNAGANEYLLKNDLTLDQVVETVKKYLK